LIRSFHKGVFLIGGELGSGLDAFVKGEGEKRGIGPREHGLSFRRKDPGEGLLVCTSMHLGVMQPWRANSGQSPKEVRL